MSPTNDALGNYFADVNEEDARKMGDVLDRTSSQERGEMKPGKYVMDVLTFAGNEKGDGSRYISPHVVISSKAKSLMLNFALKVADEGTRSVPNGTMVLHRIVLAPAAGADQKKVENTFKMMKPQIAALTGVEDLKLTESFIREYFTIDSEFDSSGKLKVLRPHKMLNKVYVTIEEAFNENTNKINLEVKSMRAFKDGDISITTGEESKDDSTEDAVQEELPFTGEPEAVVEEQPQQEDVAVDTEANKGQSVAAEDIEQVEDF